MTISLIEVTRERAISIDPRLAHIDAMVYIRGDDHLGLWSRHSSESRRLYPPEHQPLEWREDGSMRWVGIGLNGKQHVRVEWRFDLVDGRVLCCFGVVSLDGPEATAWARRFAEQWNCLHYDLRRDARLLDRALQDRLIPADSRIEYVQVSEAMREESRRLFDEQIAEHKRKRANPPPPLASADHVAEGIPAITDALLAERAAMVRPLVMKCEYEDTFDEFGGPVGFRERCLGLHDIGPQSDLRGQSFTWSEDLREPALGLVAAKTVVTLHTYGYYGMFKPSIAEVLAQAPEDLGEYVAFSIEGPSTADDLGRDQAAFDAGFHVATVTYYRQT